MPNIVKATGMAPYQAGDDTRNWVENSRVDSKLKPAFMLRYATDTNFLRTVHRTLYGSAQQKTRAMMNLGLPCQRVPGIINWSVTETGDNIVQSAQCEMYNCLYTSTLVGTLNTALPSYYHSPLIVNNWISNSLGVVDKIAGNVSNNTVETPGVTAIDNINPNSKFDISGYRYHEQNVKYRLFAHTQVSITGSTTWPNPDIPSNDVDNDVTTTARWPNATDGIGAFYLLIDSEIVKVVHKSGTNWWIPPGGRGIGSTPTAHAVGAPVKVLGMGPPSGEWTGMGYLNVDDFKPQTSLMRPGTCFTSYEGWGSIALPLSHAVSNTRNYVFTGYWFVTGAEPSMASDGVPKMRLDLKSAGWMLDKQKITPDILRRAKTQFGQWRIGEKTAAKNGQTIWGAAGATRDIPGDWVDYDSWDPSMPSSYPLKIKVELAQHKEFYDHMTSTQDGNKCLLCRDEHNEWLKTHRKTAANFIDEQRAVGKHIYKSSIRVLREKGGPIKTYLRLMAVIAMAAWDHPAYGTELSQSFSKIPNALFNNMRAINTGLIFNGQLSMNRFNKEEQGGDWTSFTYTDEDIVLSVISLTCPFESTYDKTPFSQPMFDLAELNGNDFWINREGYMVFKPKHFSYRPYYQIGQWFQRYGASISGFSTNISSDSIITQCWVSGTSAFGSQMTVLAGGTGVQANGDLKMYSPLGGNSQGLSLTSGVQQVETISLDNRVLGLDWNTNPSGWGTVEDRDGEGKKILNALPDMYNGHKTLPGTGNATAKAHPRYVKQVQRTIQFFLTRHLITVIGKHGKALGNIAIDGQWGPDTDGGVTALRALLGVGAGGSYTAATYTALLAYLKANKHYIQFDIFWYVVNKRPWEEYLSAITGVAVKTGKKFENNDYGGEDPGYAIDDHDTQSAVGEWTKSFAKSMINAGNKVVDDSVTKAVARTVSSDYADPRIQPADIIWVDVPGFLTAQRTPPFTNGVYVESISRQLDLQAGTYSATYSGSRFTGSFNQGLANTETGYGFWQ